jgi:hypothetical protein
MNGPWLLLLLPARALLASGNMMWRFCCHRSPHRVKYAVHKELQKVITPSMAVTWRRLQQTRSHLGPQPSCLKQLFDNKAGLTNQNAPAKIQCSTRPLAVRCLSSLDVKDRQHRVRLLTCLLCILGAVIIFHSTQHAKQASSVSPTPACKACVDVASVCACLPGCARVNTPALATWVQHTH